MRKLFEKVVKVAALVHSRIKRVIRNVGAWSSDSRVFSKRSVMIPVPPTPIIHETVEVKRDLLGPAFNNGIFIHRLRGAWMDQEISKDTYETACILADKLSSDNDDNESSVKEQLMDSLIEDLNGLTPEEIDMNPESVFRIFEEFSDTYMSLQLHKETGGEIKEIISDIAKIIPETLYGYDAFLEHHNLELFIQENVDRVSDLVRKVGEC